MKNSWYAFVLSFVVPGAGLAYCHKWTWAAGNLALVTVAIAVVVFFFPGSLVYDHIHYLIVALAAGSAGFAHAVATQMVNEGSPK